MVHFIPPSFVIVVMHSTLPKKNVCFPFAFFFSFSLSKLFLPIRFFIFLNFLGEFRWVKGVLFDFFVFFVFFRIAIFFMFFYVSIFTNLGGDACRQQNNKCHSSLQCHWRGLGDCSRCTLILMQTGTWMPLMDTRRKRYQQSGTALFAEWKR